MNQEQLLAQKDELAREYHLGELELQCTPWTFKGWAIFTGVIVGVVLFTLVLPVAILAHAMTTQYLVILLSVALILESFLYLMNNRAVYLYTNGLVYLRRSGGRVVHWEEIHKVWIQGDETTRLVAELYDDTRIRFPTLPSRGSASDKALQKFIEKMALARRLPDQ